MEHTARFWDRIAEGYAAKPVADQAAYERKLAITREYLHPEAEVLELGCGTGSTAIAHAPFAAHIRATDVSAKMIEIARAKAAAEGVDNIDFRVAAAATVGAADASLDAVLALSLLHLLEDWRAAIAAAFRALKPGGVLVTSTACMDDGFKLMRLVAPLGRRFGVLPTLSFFTRDELERAMTDAGFVIEQSWRPSRRKGLFVVAQKPR
ncbi:MAG: class I SAM-dependent methyltransferase [Pseudomonadota bacterium]